MNENRLILIRPCEKYIESIQLFKKEFEINGDSMEGTSFLKEMKTVEEWLAHLRACSSPETVPDNLVPSVTYLALRKKDNYLVGMIDIRYYLNDFLLLTGGHIGYSVRKSERRKGYASEMLKLALKKCKEIGLDKVLITCNKNNIASEKVIIKNKGVLENKTEKNGAIYHRYWISI